jgi:tRNA U34 5-methylaminomethyl-2-thiouridine-forming methyltransferase MnmC
MDFKKYTWIRTRDGSPTLWSNEDGASFRSQKGAFTESWKAFVEPALRRCEKLRGDGTAPELVVGEFGLGPGTNWMLWNLACEARGLRCAHFAIERETGSFAEGLAQWEASANEIAAFLLSQGLLLEASEIPSQLRAAAARLRVHPSIEAALAAGEKADLWFHDPFGFELNPEAYGPEMLELCRQLWKERAWGASYACNRAFQRNLLALPGLRVSLEDAARDGLKRERLEFDFEAPEVGPKGPI